VFIVVMALGVLAFALPGATSEQPGAKSEQSAPTVAEKPGPIEILATGLDSPRKVTWDSKRGRLLVAESGKSCGAGPQNCFNKTGAVFSYEPGANRGTRIATGLPTLTLHLGGRVEVIGVHEVNPQDVPGWGGDLLAAIGLGYTATAADRAGFGPDAMPLGQITRITESGRLIPVADLVTYEGQFNPDGAKVECNPFGMVTDATGSVVADAAANAVMRVENTGKISVVDVPPRLQVKDKSIDSGPTGIVRGPDGAYYVGELTGVPFPVGGARVWKLGPGPTRTLVSNGFTNILDLAIDRKGRLLVLEMAEHGLLSGDTTGRLVRIEPNGEHTVLASEGLVNPGGVEVTPDGDVYITNHTNGPNAGGELLRIRGLG
jgi:hypothetical protein